MSAILSASSSAEQATARPGRPPVYAEAERARLILEAAEQVFATSGYGAATMEEIARAAGMSKRTLYAFYPDKEQLLGAVTVAADDFPWEDAGRIPLADPLDELRHRLITAVEFVLNPRQIRLTRLLISEAAHLPALAKNFHDRVMVKCEAYVAAALESVICDEVDPKAGSANKVVSILLGAALGDAHLLALFGKSKGLRQQQAVARVNAALDLCGFSAASRRKTKPRSR